MLDSVIVNSRSGATCVYRHARTRRVTAFVTIFIFVSFLAVLGDLHSSPVALGAGAFLLALCIFEGVGWVRMATIKLTDHSLVYRSQLRTQRFDREEIRSVTAAERFRVRLWNTPILELKDGRKIWFSEFSIPAIPFVANTRPWASRGLDVSEAAKQSQLLSDIGYWLSRRNEPESGWKASPDSPGQNSASTLR